jgi:hypothetical protein
MPPKQFTARIMAPPWLERQISWETFPPHPTSTAANRSQSLNQIKIIRTSRKSQSRPINYAANISQSRNPNYSQSRSQSPTPNYTASRSQSPKVDSSASRSQSPNPDYANSRIQSLHPDYANNRSQSPILGYANSRGRTPILIAESNLGHTARKPAIKSNSPPPTYESYLKSAAILSPARTRFAKANTNSHPPSVFVASHQRLATKGKHPPPYCHRRYRQSRCTS